VRFFVMQHSLFIPLAIFAAMGAAIGVIWRPIAGVTFVLLGVGTVAGFWQSFKSGKSTLVDLAQLDAPMGGGCPVLLMIYSDT